MTNFNTVESAIDPANRISFLLDWELTQKCNLDCSYCATGTYGGHDNTTKHPSKIDCLKTLDFMFEYVDLYMNYKTKGTKYVMLNVYGGESLHHPDIVEILSEVRKKYESYADRWHLTVTTTTNAILANKKLQKIIPYIDEFIVSYHPENTEKQHQQFKDNILTISQSGKRVRCSVLMHEDSIAFNKSLDMIEWCKNNNIKFTPKQLDGTEGTDKDERNYNKSQVIWFDKLWKGKSYGVESTKLSTTGNYNLTDVGRACCGGRQFCLDKDYKTRHAYIDNKFPDWYCSVNWFFLYVKQVNGEIFVNKDCKMNFSSEVGPIGNLSDTRSLLNTLSSQLAENSLPVIQCKKYSCMCGMCAPKSSTIEEYNEIIKKYQKNYGEYK